MPIIKILITDTLPFFNDFDGNVIKLPSDSDSLSKFKLPKIENECIYIIEASPDRNNPLNYDGVNIALRLYFLAILNHINNFRIFLIGFEDKTNFFQFCTYSNILKCPGIDYIEIGNDIDKIKEIELSSIDLRYAKQSILNIGIKPPASYKSHHSISNEWAILRWAKALKIEDNSLSETKMKVDNDLYYNYLKTIYPITSNVNITSRVLLHIQKDKILLIDDEVEKGWGLIFNKICANKVELFGNEFKDWDAKKIINESFEKAKNADVVILDMRLHDNDFNQDDITEITSYQILEKIKNHNAGIQVIIFSASNKIWNLQAFQKLGADGFIVKESPENSVDTNFTSQSISNLYTTIDSCLEYAFVKVFYEKFLLLKENLERRKKSKELPKEFVDEYLKWLEFGIINLLKYKSNEGNVLTFLMFFSVLENISSRLINVENPENTPVDGEFKFKFRINDNYLKSFTWDTNFNKYNKTNVDLLSARNINWNQKVLNTLDVLGCDLPNINNLVKKRNDIIHSNSTTGDRIQISKAELKKLFEIITNNIENIP
jgi:CheY-like chemotaxis protein